MIVRARACANIALAKYWGKSDVEHNLPAVPSVSLTLDGLVTRTEVALRDGLARDRVALDGRLATEGERARVVRVLDRVRALAGDGRYAEVLSQNHFPTAAGLASSASGFAALAGASLRAYGVDASAAEISSLARAASASAARSVYEGFVELPAGTPGQASLAARPLHPAAHWDVRLIVCVTADAPKKIGSTEGMERSRRTSPFYEAWVDAAPALAAEIVAGIARRDLDAVGLAMEQSTMAFHGCALASSPSVVYLAPATLAVLAEVRALRDAGVAAYATMDAGPNVKVLCLAEEEARVRRHLRDVPGVRRALGCAPGPGLEIEEVGA
jgi:diphosphomevalonate decarboxylase